MILKSMYRKLCSRDLQTLILQFQVKFKKNHPRAVEKKTKD